MSQHDKSTAAEIEKDTAKRELLSFVERSAVRVDTAADLRAVVSDYARGMLGEPS